MGGPRSGYTAIVRVDQPTLLQDRYRLEHVLARGGMAEVWAAWDERLARPVAVKLLRADLTHRIDIRDRLRREARAAARLDHPGVVRVFDVGEVDGVPFLVMERLPGETLADRYRAGEVDDAWLLQSAVDIAEALAIAHESGVIHRDIKPGNIMLTEAGEARLGDFGIATSLDLDGDATTTGLILGTPSYLAPERIEGAPATPATDIYGLGVVLYEGFSGRRPFSGESPVAVAKSVLEDAAPPLSQLRADLPATLTRAIDRAISRVPDHRPASARAFETALRAAAGELAVPRDPTIALDISDTRALAAPSPAVTPHFGVALAATAQAARRSLDAVTEWWHDIELRRGPVARWAAIAVAAAMLAGALATLGWLSASSGTDADPLTNDSPATTAPVVTTAPTTEQPPEDERGHPGKGNGKGQKDKDADEGGEDDD